MVEEQKTRYDVIKDELLGDGTEVESIEQIQMDVSSQQMLKIYEKNTSLFLDKLGKHLDEFEELLTEFENYKKMMIVQKALSILDAYEPLILNLQQEKEFLFSKIKGIADNARKEIIEAKQETKEDNKPKDEKKMIQEIIILRQSGKSYRRIAEVVGIPYSTLRRMVKEETGEEAGGEEEESSDSS